MLLLGGVVAMAGTALLLRSRVQAVVPAAAPAFKVIAEAMPGAEPLLVCDLDGDGRSDVVRKRIPQPLVWLGRGDGYFDVVDFPFYGPTEIPITPIDLDRDRLCDFILTDSDRRTRLLRGWRYVWPVAGRIVDESALPAPYLALDGGARVLRRQEAIFSGVGHIEDRPILGPEAGVNLIPGDFDGDQYVDLLEQPTRELPPPTEEPAAALGGDIGWPRFYDPAKGYFASADQAAAAPSPAAEPFAFARLRYNVTASQQTVLPLARSSALHAEQVNLLGGDFNGDGKMDLLRQPRARFAAGGDVALLYFGAATGFRVERVRALAGKLVDTTLASDDVMLAVGDWNGDGKADLLWRRDKGLAAGRPGITLWLSRGDGSFELVVPTGLSPEWAAARYRFYAADLDGDGRAGLLLQDPVTGSVLPIEQVAVPPGAAR